MERIFQYTIPPSYDKKPIDFYLKSVGFSSANIIALKKMEESILLNGVWSYVNTPLKEGDLLTIHIKEKEGSEKILPVALPLSIIYEDEDLLVVNKPAGMPVHPSQNNYDNTLANAVSYYYSLQHIPFVFRCINRLDRDTTGLTVIAKHMVSANILGKMTADKTLQREYRALCLGIPSPPEGIIEKPIGRVSGSTIERCIDWENGDYALTHYKVLKAGENVSFLSLMLETGRTHQIRVHMASAGHPLLGDSLYNLHCDKTIIDRQALHSYRLTFPHPITKKLLSFTAPIPEDFPKSLL